MDTNYTTDNRWSPGASGAEVPANAPAAYSARWIDMGDTTPADVLPDRQGFAYNTTVQRDTLIAFLNDAGTALRIPGQRDETTSIEHRDGGWRVAMRRAGGYVYVDAWLTPAIDNDPSTTGPEDQEYEVSCMIQIAGESPADAAQRFAEIIADWTRGNVEWLEFDVLNATTRETTQVRLEQS